MAKLVFGKLKDASAREIGAKRSGVKSARVSDGNGGRATVRTVDVAADDFGRAFTWVFGANVRKARAENKRVAGVADRVPPKR